MSNINELKPTINLNPFARFCCTIGNLPSSYMASLTYEEQLMWLCDYLKNTVIPTVNNNAECVKELQELYVELKNYVDNYFENLDIQSEVNKKLDDMAEDGTLENIINQEIFGEINNNISKLNNDISEINNTIDNDYTICIGDSFGVGYTPTGFINSWIKLLKNMLKGNDNNFFYKAYGGAGFLATSDNNFNFLTLIKDLENSITLSNRKYVKKIIVVGGVNDNPRQFTLSALKEAIKNFISYCNLTYPNAKIYIGCTGYWLQPNSLNNNERMVKKTLIAYKSCEENGAVYLGNIEYIMHIPFYASLNEDKSTDIHPNELGQNELAKCVFQCLNGNIYSTNSLYNINDTNSFPTTQYNFLSALNPQNTNSINISKQVINNITKFSISATFYTTGAVLETSSNTLDLSDLLTISNDIVPQFQSLEFSLKTPIFILYYDENNKLQNTQAILKFGRNFNSSHSTTTKYLYLYFNYNFKLKGLIIPKQDFYCDSLLS